MIDEFGNETDEDTADVGGLAVYNDPNVQSSVAARTKASNDYKAYYDNMALELSKKRYGPSFSERMFQLSAAFATPTKRRGLSAVLGNVAPVLAAQQQAKREGEISRQEALDKLQGNRLAQFVALANQDVTTATAMARLKAAANKPVKGIEVNGQLVDPASNRPIGAEYNRVPKAEYYKALEQAPTPENLQAAVAYYPAYAVELKTAYERGLKNKGR